MAVGGHTRGFLALLAALGALATAFALAAAAPAEAKSACESFGKKEASELRISQARRSIRCLVNRERKQRGLRKLGRDRRLQRASQRHSKYMKQHGCFEHDCPGELHLEDRLQLVDYLVNGLSQWAWGENIAWGERWLGSPKSIMRGWMHSPPHKENILNPTFREIGVGFVRGTPVDPNADGGIYTTDFGLKVR